MIWERLIDLDRTITLGLNSLHSPAMDQFWMALSDKAIWFPAYLIVAVYIFRQLGRERGLIVVTSVILTVVFCDQVSNLVKLYAERLRPCYDGVMLQNGLHYPEIRKGFFGFFSGHASNAFGFITCTLLGLRNNRTQRYMGFAIGGYLWATLVAFSRVMMGKHFFGDILVGTAFGMLAGFLFSWSASWIIRKYYSTEAE